MPYNPQASELNEVIQKTNPHVFEMLSQRGKEIYFPKLGILSQSAEASSCAINATIGIALEEDKKTMCLPSIAKNIALPPENIFTYAGSSGLPKLRDKWKEMLTAKNPSLTSPVSLPVVTSALTHGLSLSGYLFVNAGDEVILPDLYWENYDLIFDRAWGAKLATFETFDSAGGFNCEALRAAIGRGGTGKKIVILNFPNNPTGYSPTVKEAQAIRDIIVAAAEAGNNVVVIIDDSYFGLVYEEGIVTESLFAGLAGAHERVLAVKLDGPTKEDYVWGFRTGFITFGTARSSKELYASLEAKASGAIRGSISNAPHISQSLLAHAYAAESYNAEKREKFETLKRRYLKVKEILAAHPQYAAVFTPLPFNSGYFMCVKINAAIDAEKMRKLLISKYSVGVIVFGPIMRLAFSSTPTDKLPALFEAIYNAGKELLGS